MPVSLSRIIHHSHSKNIPSHLFHNLDNCSSNLALFELAHGPLKCTADRLESLLYNPIDQAETCNVLSNRLDSHCLLLTSNYMDEEKISNRIVSGNKNITFSVTHFGFKLCGESRT